MEESDNASQVKIKAALKAQHTNIRTKATLPTATNFLIKMGKMSYGRKNREGNLSAGAFERHTDDVWLSDEPYNNGTLK